MKKIEVVYLKPSDIQTNFGNPRKITKQQYAELKKSIETLGDFRNLVIDEYNNVIAGNQRLSVMKDLKSLDYNVKCKLMNAKYYQVPQSRERLIWIGVRRDLNIEPSFPIPSNKLITVEEALKNKKIKIENYGSNNCLNLYDFIQKGKNGSSINKNIKKKYGYNAILYNLIKINEKKQAPTITKSVAGASGFLHWEEKIRLYPDEIKILCSFYEDYELAGKPEEKVNRLGNAVMPNMMKAIAENIKINILDKYYKEILND